MNNQEGSLNRCAQQQVEHELSIHSVRVRREKYVHVGVQNCQNETELNIPLPSLVCDLCVCVCVSVFLMKKVNI